MAGLTVGYARSSTYTQDLTAQREALERLFAEAKGAGYHAGVTSPRATGSIAVQPWLGLGRPRHREQEPWAVRIWIEETPEECGRLTWRGLIRHFPQDGQSYVQTFDEIIHSPKRYFVWPKGGENSRPQARPYGATVPAGVLATPSR